MIDYQEKYDSVYKFAPVIAGELFDLAKSMPYNEFVFIVTRLIQQARDEGWDDGCSASH